MLCGFIEFSVKASLNYYCGSLLVKFRFLLKLVLLNDKALWSSMFLTLGGAFGSGASRESFGSYSFVAFLTVIFAFYLCLVPAIFTN